jgi:bifunctional UDP-N-acetylglucosamine pyrophosphorylase / glucosamine-1-phosphate N-acetyltransferase
MTDKNSSLPPLACVILAAGQGTRMRSELPKVLHPVANKSMLGHVIAACEALQPERLVIVAGPANKAAIEKAIAPIQCVIQQEPLGTGDAVKAARNELKNFNGDVIVLFGDGPLVTPESIRTLQQKRQETKAAIVVAGFLPEDTAAFGRLVLDDKGALTAIVETAEAMPEQKQIKLCNGGIMLFAGDKILSLLDQIKNSNSKKEFYLTDAIALARKAGDTCAVAILPFDEVYTVNSRTELAEAEKLMQRRLRKRAMVEGATLTDPDSVFLSADTKIGRDVTIGPNVFVGPGVEIADKADIRAFCHIEQTQIKEGAIIGPFARLRPGTIVGPEAHIGNFVELKNTQVERGAKINHLSYIGDADVGEKANIGAGTITCNYDGYRKHRTEIGAGTFIGSNSALVAPVKIGDGAYVGAGSVITMEVPAHTLAVARGRQANIEDWARRFREEQEQRKKNEGK